MRAAVLDAYGVPVPGEFREPEAGPGQAVVQVLAAGVNPVDVAISAGNYHAGKPPLPLIAGREGVGLLGLRGGDENARVYFDAPILPFGAMAQRVLVDPACTYPVPAGISDGVAVALGIAGLTAWLALTQRARLQAGEHVLVLGASGVLGQIAVQGAKLLGAARVIAAARSPEGLQRCLALGAHAAVRLDESTDLPGALSEAAQGRIDVVLDPVFGAPFAAALQAASFGARIVQIGAAAGAKTTVTSAAIRGKMLVIMGYALFAAPHELKAEAYRRLTAAALAGELTVEVESLALEQVAEAWRRLAVGAHRKLVLVP